MKNSSGTGSMNVGVPGQGNDSDFYVIVGAMLAMFGAMVAYFHRRGWL